MKPFIVLLSGSFPRVQPTTYDSLFNNRRTYAKHEEE